MFAVAPPVARGLPAARGRRGPGRRVGGVVAVADVSAAGRGGGGGAAGRVVGPEGGDTGSGHLTPPLLRPSSSTQ